MKAVLIALSTAQELQEARTGVSELEKKTLESETLLDKEKSRTTSLQQQLTKEQETSTKV